MSGRSRAVNAALGAAALLATAAAVVVGCSEGSAEEPSAPPRSFFGVVPQTSLGQAEIDRMGEGKVGTLRIHAPWALLDQTAEDDYELGPIDGVVLTAARNEIEVLPFMFGTPSWVSELQGDTDCDPNCGAYAPRTGAALDAWSEFVGAMVDRYGPQGTLWEEHPDVDPVPITKWQIWNEQNSPTFYQPAPDISAYAKLLQVAEQAIHERDPEAEVILGGMFGNPLDGNPPAFTAWEYLRGLYDAGAADSFDAVAVHPYGNQVSNIEFQVERMREQVEAAGDDASTWITEIGWASGGPPHPLNKGPAGQAKRLTDAFQLLVDKRLEWDVAGVTWFSWRDLGTEGVCDWCPESGLFEEGEAGEPLEPKASWEAFVSFTGGS